MAWSEERYNEFVTCDEHEAERQARLAKMKSEDDDE